MAFSYFGCDLAVSFFRATALGLGTTDSNIEQQGRKENVTPRYRMRATALCARNIHLAVSSASQKSKQIGHQRKKALLTVRTALDINIRAGARGKRSVKFAPGSEARNPSAAADLFPSRS